MGHFLCLDRWGPASAAELANGMGWHGEATVVVNEDQLSKAIGKEGKNVRLAAKLTEWKIDLVSAHATATKMGDVIEAQAMGKTYGAIPWVTGLKSYMGHTMGSCGAIETILMLYMMQENVVAPTLNLESVDERCAMVRHARQLIQTPIRTAAVQNFAFGGVNTCLILSKVGG